MPSHTTPSSFSSARTLVPALAAVALAACTTTPQDSSPATTSPPLACNDTLKSVSLGADTRVLHVQPFKQGEPVKLANSPTTPPPPNAPVDLCLVKLVVGPGSPGNPEHPSTSPGIGIEIWLPTNANWNHVIRAYGSGGWAGGYHTDTTRIGNSGAANAMHLGAVAKGYAISQSDHGHGRTPYAQRSASFALNPDGSINTTLWRDFSERSMVEQADKTKAVVRAFYGKAHRRAYFDGYSTGGRQGYKLAQKHPKLYDGILAGAPAFNWTNFITAELYPQVVMQRDLGAPIAVAKLNAASAAATAACSGAEKLGFLIDPTACRYDATRDATMLCSGEQGQGVTGTNADTAKCLSAAQARALNKIWYGQTRDGSAPDPSQDTGGDGRALSNANHLWWGLPRGSTLDSLAGAEPFAIASAQVALSLQNVAIAQKSPFLVNPKLGTGADGWKNLDAAALADATMKGRALQPQFADINTDSVDLAALRDSGAKVLTYHGWADNLIPGQGSIHYFTRAAQAMGGADALQRFNRLYMIPGFAHTGRFDRAGSIDPATGAATDLKKVPLPQSASGRDELFVALRRWVEEGVAPASIDISSSDGSLTMPICPHPQKAVLAGGVRVSGSGYTCR